jgi:hypothetical protein
VDFFDLDRSLVQDYQRFARSFTQIRAADIQAQVEGIYATRRFWPEPLISLNPHFERDAGIDTLVAEGSLHPHTGNVFRVGGQPITLYRHQAQSIAKAAARQSFVVTTGTGSGKSFCFFVPIIDAAIRARVAGEAPRTRAGSPWRGYRHVDTARTSRGRLQILAAETSRHRGLRCTFPGSWLRPAAGSAAGGRADSSREVTGDNLLTSG